ncbi:phosphoadenosine phosphosulfate reductase family protein [Candidatus Nanohalobium constans]|uniref:Phosphoadenosine phosphosulfate reductase n=1 Tax=Candidatus Nanohalobium constans TaxID=2565781 RepID=A0A5Q0UI86_9ARCH|nr:phosphoadenosine phosphosulfate reductase family protein [Candidatus Nanohalobium constans]QGA81051.1 phosphoadenosine phosphosulfate reductase [Candidatus Nanohalobium constans]
MEAPVTRDEIENAPIKAKIRAGEEVVKQALEEYDTDNVVIGFTGGKDSTLTAWLVKRVCEEHGFDKPKFMFVDHGQHFDELEDYVERLADNWGFEVMTAKNEDLIEKADQPGDKVPVAELNDRNQEAAEEVGDYEEVPWLMDTEAGNHLLKTVPMHELLENHNIEAVINGVRWDEHESRGDEDFYSPRSDPDHIRVHPILQLDERDVWDVSWFHMVPDITGVEINSYPETEEDLPEGLNKDDVPISPKYWAGFRSLGSEVSTDKSDEIPAWLQDVENTKERAGRAQNKDDKEIMDKLRKLGYMAVPIAAAGSKVPLMASGTF